jgi:carbamoyl-phosphate synthase large subunit
MKKNVLVTGAGAVLGQGILRALQNMDDHNLVIHSADPDFRSTGHWLANKAHLIPFAADPSYMKVIKRKIEEEKIDIVLIGTDTELPFFAESKKYLEESTNVRIVVSSSDVINIANDKWKTASFLEKNGFDYPRSVMAFDKKAVGEFQQTNSFPFFAKPVDGARSKGIVVIESEKELNAVLQNPLNLVIQEFLPGDDGEFTSGCVVVDGKCKAIVTLQRDLRDGNTYRAYYKKEYAKYNSFIAEVAEKLGVEGPCNFQFRIRDGKPVIFEINSRFSGTTPIRYMFGFNEVAAILNYYLERKEIIQPELREGMVARAWSDIFVADNELNEFKKAQVMSSPSASYYPFNQAK